MKNLIPECASHWNIEVTKGDLQILMMILGVTCQKANMEVKWSHILEYYTAVWNEWVTVACNYMNEH